MRPDTQYRWATVKHFRLVIALINYGSVLHASSALNISQPTASKLLNELEEAIGAQLFNRNRRGVTPTELGRAFAERGRSVLNQIDSVSELIASLKKGYEGKVIIGLIQTSSSHLISLAIEDVLSSDSAIQIKVIEGGSESIINKLVSAEVDLIMGRRSDIPHHFVLHQEILFNENAFIVANRNHPLRLRKRVTAEELLSYPWVLPPLETSLRLKLEDFFYNEKLRPPLPRVETSSFFTTSCLLEKTEMLGVLPGSALSTYHYPDKINILSGLEPIAIESIGIMRPKEAHLSPASEIFIKSFRNVLEKLSIDFHHNDAP
ncbi:LysR family transcriptional regulator [Kosakonia cowanii]|uniref:LysR family transcriptional regulator n=1 Tax=Kosakonia cowanii TaxID=208223 RepID=UPI0021E9A622|nr:LysR family transcriptional regulator [Kosakonia cowanii]